MPLSGFGEVLMGEITILKFLSDVSKVMQFLHFFMVK